MIALSRRKAQGMKARRWFRSETFPSGECAGLLANKLASVTSARSSPDSPRTGTSVWPRRTCRARKQAGGVARA
jgi:hypothetical protein